MEDHPDNTSEEDTKQSEKKIVGKKPLPRKKSTPLEKPAQPQEKIIDLNIDTLIEHAKKIHDEVENKLDAIYQLSGHSPDEVSNFLNNPNNFKTEEWENAQKFREELKNNLLKKLGKGAKEKADEKEKSKLPAFRKKKTLGSRKGWMPMN